MGVQRSAPLPPASARPSWWFAGALLIVILALLLSGWGQGLGTPSALAPPSGPATLPSGLLRDAVQPSAVSHGGAGVSGSTSSPSNAPALADHSAPLPGTRYLRAFPAPTIPLGPSPSTHHPERSAGGSATSPANIPLANDTWAGPTLAPFGGPFSVTNSYLLTAGYDYSALLNASSTSSFFFAHGTVGIFASSDSGATWGVSFPGQATDWTTATSKNYGDLFEGLPDFQNVFASSGTPPPLTEELAFPMVAANATGSNAVMVAPFGPVCFTINLGSCTATNAEVNATYGAAWGFAATRTADGGTSWGTPVPILSKAWWRTAYLPSGLGCNAGIYLLPANQTTSVSLAATPATGSAFVAWTIDQWVTPPSPLSCQSGSVFFTFTSLYRSLYVATSVDGGATWGVPVLIARNTYGTTTSNDPPLDVHLTAGPGPAYVVTGAFDDLPNATSPGTNTAVATFLSSNNGKSWSYRGDTTVQPNVVLSSAPDWFFNGTVPWITADNWSGSPYSGNLYLVWNDFPNGTGPPAILVSTNSGTGWSSPVVVSNRSRGLTYLNPTMSVASDGTVWVSYTGVNPATGSFAPYGAYSTNGGSNWTQEFRVADRLSTPSISPQADGPGFPALAATPSGASVLWSDCRLSACQLPARLSNWTAMFATVEAVRIATNAGAIKVNATVFGNTTRLALPTAVGWLSHATVSLSAPRYLRTPNGSAFYVYSSLAGASTVSTDPATFTYVSGNLTLVYATSQPASISGDLRPQVVGANLTIAVGSDLPTHVTLTPVSSGPTGSYSFGAVVPGGLTFTVIATAALYQTNTTTVATRSLQTSTIHILLARTLGWIAGNVSTAVPGGLAGAILTINQSVPAPSLFNRTSGHFNVSVGWGSYTLKVAETGFVTYTSTVLTVPPRSGIVVNPTLVGSWLNGSVAPVSGAVVEVNGTPVHLSGTGASQRFSVALPGGTYVVTAHATGYSYYAQRVVVAAGASKTLTIALTNRAHIVGYVTPPSAQSKRATLLADQGAVPVAANGSFDASVVAAGVEINLTASLAGYVTLSKLVSVQAGNVSWQNLTLNLTPATCTGSHCGTTPTCPPTCPHTGGSTSSGVPTYLYAVLAAVVAAAGLAVLALWRRRKSGTATPESEEAQAEPGTDDAAPSEIYGADRPPVWEEGPAPPDETAPPS